MSRLSLLALLVAFVAVAIGAAPVPKAPPPPAEWSMLGGTPARNMVNLREKLEKFPTETPKWEDPAGVQKWEKEWVLWKAQLGGVVNVRSGNCSSPVVANGHIYIGTNNGNARNPRDTRKHSDDWLEKLDKGILLCFEEKSGKFLWQAVHDKLPGGIENDWPGIGLTATPTVVGNRVYYVSNQCRVVCADAKGFADGNQGIRTEKYQDATDADIVWEYDMMRELKVYPHNASNCSPLVVGDRLFACTSNGVDLSHIDIPSPDAPTLICLDRHTGKLLWKDNSPGKNILHGQWSSPAYAEEPVPQVLHGQGDGWLRAFDPATGKLLWQFECNRKGAKYDLGGTGDRSDFLATPVVYNGRVYIGTGQCPEHSTGLANLWCIDLKKAVELGAKVKDRDVSPELVVRVEKQNDEEKVVARPNPASALSWVYGGAETRKWAPRVFKFGRTLSTVAVVDDIVYAAELHGYLHCLNAKTGEEYWRYYTDAPIWGSPYYVDGKVLVGTDAGDLLIFRHAKQPEKFDGVEAAKGAANPKAARAIHRAANKRVEEAYLLAKIELPAAIRTTPTVVNGVLYVATENTLYAIRGK
jgi:outer membrane protein assembly factor BamB